MRITNDNNELSQFIIIILGVVQIIATLAGGSLMDKYPKKPFLIIGELFMVICLFAIYFFSYLEFFVIVMIFLHTIAYSFSIGQLLMYYSAKMLESNGHVVLVNWSLTFVVAISAEFMMKELGIGTMCLIFGVLLSACVALRMKGIPADKEVESIK